MSTRAKNLILKRDKETFKYILDNIKFKEPAPILSLRGVGKDVLFEHLSLKIKDYVKDYEIYCLDVTSRDELSKLIETIKNDNKNIILILNFALEEDLSDLVRKISDIRTKRDEEFNYILFINPRHVRRLIDNKDKAVYRNLHILKPLEKEDVYLLLDYFKKKYKIQLEKNQLQNIHKIAGGHTGLIKSLFFALGRDNIRLDADFLINPNISHRLDGILKDLLGDVTRQNLYKYRNLAELLGIVEKGRFTNKFMEEYFNNLLNKDSSIESIMSYAEKKVFTLLKDREGEIVTREEVAEALWGNDKDEKYSDWAIDQTVYRIRKAIELSPYKLITKKGEGFVVEFC